MKKRVFILILLYTCIITGGSVKGAEISNDDYLKKIRKDVITIGIQNKDESLQDFKESHLAKYLREELKLNVKLKKVSEEEGINELLSEEIDFLENTSLEKNPKIKYINYNLLNNIIIVCRDNYQYNINQLANKKIGIINKKNIKSYPIQLLSRNNNIKFYKNFNEMAKALENKEIDLGISDRENRFEILLHKNLVLAEDRREWKWKEGIATANSKYYKIIDIINSNFYRNTESVNSFFDAEKDYMKKIKNAFYQSLSEDEKEYINRNKAIKVLVEKNSFPVLYKEANNINGLLYYFMGIFSELTKTKIEYIDLKDKKMNNTNNLIEEKVEYEKHKKIPNIIYRTNLVMVSYNNYNLDPGLSSIVRTDKNIIGLPKQIELNQNSEMLQNNIKYYENIDYAIKALKNNDVNFILMDKSVFDCYSLSDKGKNIIKFKELDDSAIYYLDANNKTLSSILKKIHKIYQIEEKTSKAQWNNVKDYMQKKYIKTIYQHKEIYKFIVIVIISILSLFIIFIIINKKNIDANKKLETILDGDSNLDIVEIDLKINKVECKNGLIFDNQKKINLDEYLKIMNLNIDDYLNKGKTDILKQCNKVLINDEYKYFKQYIYPSSNKKIISIITDVTKEAREKIALQEKIRIDNLTGLINRDYYEEEIEKMINKYPNVKGAFVFIDINDFKEFNDKFGHDFGDKVIKIIGGKLKSIDKNNTLAFRIAGDEFGIYKHSVKSEKEVIVFLKELCENLTVEQKYNEFVINISCSIGCTVDVENVNGIGKLRNRAETEMYKCKKRKYNQSRYKLSYHK